MDKEMYSFSCKDAGVDCGFHVCAGDEDEVIAAAQDHARRVHGKDMPAEDLRPLVKSGEMVCG